MKTINVELILNGHSNASKKSLIPLVKSYLQSIKVKGNTVLSHFDSDSHSILHSELYAIIIDETPQNSNFIDFTEYQILWYVYTLDIHGPLAQVEEGDEDGQLNFSTHLLLPSQDLFNLWESLYYDNNIKQSLLQYSKTMMEFSDKGVDTNLINCNRVILLHGPPGTGKTSLCKALAQKLSVRMQDQYSSGVLIEINTHSLFSKWFSESGKLVTKMFSKINEIVENRNLLVCVLIDEVESLAHARNQCISGNEPSDSIRVVNAVLTQIDQIKRHPNVLILTTSNITESIDLAFVDRADIKQFLGLPSTNAIYKVYYSCIEELVRVKIIKDQNMVDPANIAMGKDILCENKLTNMLLNICEKSVGLSGRSLRKIPFIAHALYLDNDTVDISDYLEAMDKAVEREKQERKHFENLIK